MSATPDDAPATVLQAAIPSLVPGCIHDDLIRAGLIGDPNFGDHEDRCRWIGLTDWEFRRQFHVPASVAAQERLELVCDGLDTIARVALDGCEIGRAANLHHPHRFDLTGLIAGEHELAITFTAPLRHIRAEEARLGTRPVNGDWDPYIFARKYASNFGWDWGPRVPTVGIWRDLRLEAWCGARIACVTPLVRQVAAAGSNETDTGDWSVSVRCHVATTTAAARYTVARLTNPAGVEVSRATQPVTDCGRELTLQLSVSNPALWQPRGYGAQPLYRLDVELHDGVLASDGDAPAARAARDTWSGRVAFRHARWITTPASDAASEMPFTLEINGVAVFCRGANWIPEGLFLSRGNAATIRKRIQQAADANLNMLRVWGGGTYESDAFYDACDELGILVWQDFAFACAMYPEEPPFPALVEAEARHNIARLACHPSLVLWCGGNECIWAWQKWGFRERLQPGQTWGAAYYHELLPKLVAEIDPTRKYWPNSPYAGTPGADIPDPQRGNSHVWDRRDDAYRTLTPRFVSEFGHQSPPNYATLREAGIIAPLGAPSADADLCPPELRRRQRAAGGDAVRYEEPLRDWFGPLTQFDTWHFAAQLLQARAIATGIEWWRATAPRCMGALFWQWNDCWAGHSWSAIDSAGRRKPLWYAVRRACAPRLLTFQPVNGRLQLLAVNDTPQAWSVDVRCRRATLRGEIRAESRLHLRAGAFGNACCDPQSAVGALAEDGAEFFLADDASPTPPAMPQRALWFPRHDRELAYPEPRFSADFQQSPRHPDNARLTIRAATLVRDMTLQLDRIDPHAEIDEQLITLLPGETTTIGISQISAPTLLREAFTSRALIRPPVLQTANELGGRVESPRH